MQNIFLKEPQDKNKEEIENDTKSNHPSLSNISQSSSTPKSQLNKKNIESSFKPFPVTFKSVNDLNINETGLLFFSSSGVKEQSSQTDLTGFQIDELLSLKKDYIANKNDYILNVIKNHNDLLRRMIPEIKSEKGGGGGFTMINLKRHSDNVQTKRVYGVAGRSKLHIKHHGQVSSGVLENTRVGANAVGVNTEELKTKEVVRGSSALLNRSGSGASFTGKQMTEDSKEINSILGELASSISAQADQSNISLFGKVKQKEKVNVSLICFFR